MATFFYGGPSDWSMQIRNTSYDPSLWYVHEPQQSEEENETDSRSSEEPMSQSDTFSDIAITPDMFMAEDPIVEGEDDNSAYNEYIPQDHRPRKIEAQKQQMVHGSHLMMSRSLKEGKTLSDVSMAWQPTD